MTPVALVLISLAFIVAVAVVRAYRDPQAIARRAKERADRHLRELQARSQIKPPELHQ